MKMRKVTLRGVHLWAMPPNEGEEDYPLAPKEHCNEEGELNMSDGLFSMSYAHVFPPKIMRYQSEIGTESDLVEGWL